MGDPGSCAAPAEAVEMFSPFGNGHHPGVTPGTREEPGDRFLAPVPGPGERRAVSARPGNWPAGAARPGEAPASHTCGGLACFCLAGMSWLTLPRHASHRRKCATAMVGGHDRYGRGPAGVSRKPGRAGPLLTAIPAPGLLPGLLCISVWITCAKRRQACVRAVEMLGILPAARAADKASGWENTTRAL